MLVLLHTGFRPDEEWKPYQLHLACVLDQMVPFINMSAGIHHAARAVLPTILTWRHLQLLRYQWNRDDILCRANHRLYVSPNALPFCVERCWFAVVLFGVHLQLAGASRLAAEA